MVRGRDHHNRILVVDDSELVCDWVRYALEEAQFEVRAAASIAAAESVLSRWMPDLLLVDVNLRQHSGVELCRELKARLPFLVPVILFSARPDAELERLADDCGADGYLSKMHGAEALARKVDEIRSMILW